MKITFLGTGDAALQKNRQYTSTAIEVGGSVYLVDAGASVFSRTLDYGIDPSKLRSVFITSCNYDRVRGLPMLVDIFSWSKSFGNIPLSYYLPEKRCVNSIVELIASMSAGGAVHGDFKVYREGLVYEDENLRIFAIPTERIKNDDGRRASYAFLLYAEEKCILFSGELDTEQVSDLLNEKRIDLFIPELARFSPTRLIEKVSESIPERVYFNCIPKSERIHSELAVLQKSGLASEICAAYDGMILEV